MRARIESMRMRVVCCGKFVALNFFAGDYACAWHYEDV